MKLNLFAICLHVYKVQVQCCRDVNTINTKAITLTWYALYLEVTHEHAH